MRLFFVFCALITISCGEKDFANQVLVLLDSAEIKESHSTFFQSFIDCNYTLKFQLASSKNILVRKYGDFLYSHIILFAPSVEEFGGDLSKEVLMSFLDNGGNLIMATGEKCTALIRDIATEVGIEVHKRNSVVVDHFSHDITDEVQHSKLVLTAANLVDIPPIVGSLRNINDTAYLYRGTGLFRDMTNEAVTPILSAGKYAYSTEIDNDFEADKSTAYGSDITLIAGVQLGNNARILVSGSLDFFSNSFTSPIRLSPTESLKSGNMELAERISKWTFGEAGVLRHGSVHHYRLSDDNLREYPQDGYTIRDRVVYSIVIEELYDGKWIPYVDSNIQMEFVRVDPFVRAFLHSSPDSAVYSVTFRVPDTYGVYKFKVDYRKPGYTSLSSVTMVSVRPLTHLQYERFIVIAYPYYCSAFSMMASCVVFCLVFISYREKAKCE